jgi:hypothetical protein
VVVTSSCLPRGAWQLSKCELLSSCLSRVQRRRTTGNETAQLIQALFKQLQSSRYWQANLRAGQACCAQCLAGLQTWKTIFNTLIGMIRCSTCSTSVRDRTRSSFMSVCVTVYGIPCMQQHHYKYHRHCLCKAPFATVARTGSPRILVFLID